MNEYLYYIAYQPSGEITRTGQCMPDDLTNWPIPGEQAIEGQANDSVQYMDLTEPDNPAIADKTPVPHTVTGNIISGLPGDELQVKVTGPIADSFDIPAGETELTFTADVPGQYTLTLSGVKYLPTEVQVAV